MNDSQIGGFSPPIPPRASRRFGIRANLTSGVTHKSYSTLDEAKKAFKESKTYTAKLQTVQSPKDRKVVLGKLPATTFKIETAEEREKRFKINEEEFLSLYKKAAHYKNEQKMENYYPVFQEFTGFKINALEGIDMELLYKFFQAGLIDCIYFKNSSLFSYFPIGFRTAVRKYCQKFQNKDKCLKIRSTLPVFKEGQMVIEAVHIATLMFSGQPNPMTNMVAEGDFAIEDIYILYFGNRILHVINERFDCNYRLEAKGNNYILLSKSLQKMKEETTKTITKMIDELSLLTGPLATKDEFTAQKMHDWTVEIDGHFDKVKKKRKKIRRVEPQECR